MELEFGPYRLSASRAELIGPDGPVSVEKNPFDLLVLLAKNPDRVVSRDEIIETVWQGRIVSDAAIATAIKQARRAVGDDGTAQTVIKTVHGRGYRFVAPLTEPSSPSPEISHSESPQTADKPDIIGIGKPSVAVLPFQQIGETSNVSVLASAIPSEIIFNLSRLRWLRVISRGSSFQSTLESLSPEMIGQRLRVRYLVVGSIEAIGNMLTISIELLSCSDGELVWADRFATTTDGIHVTRREIVAALSTAMELDVPRFEAGHARRLNSQQYDAWSHFHMGLSHMFRFNEADNMSAARLFETATKLDPDFSRAYAGLSFTHWQKAFMQFGSDRDGSLREAIACADQALLIDGQDPFGNFSMGRAQWLLGDPDAGLAWLDRALTVNPNFAQCLYSKGLNLVLLGRSEEARACADHAMALSPLDPLHYAMLGVQALSLIHEERFQEAARIAEQATRSPGAHFYLSVIAAIAQELRGEKHIAKRHLDAIAKESKDSKKVTQRLFLDAFPFQDLALKQKVAGSLTRLEVD